MAVAEQEALSTVQASFVEAFTAFFRSVVAQPAVKRIDTSRGEMAPATWWVFIDPDTDAVLNHIYQAERRLRRAVGYRVIELRIIPLADVDLTALPEAETLIER